MNIPFTLGQHANLEDIYSLYKVMDYSVLSTALAFIP
jgi:hypothetical protein